MEKIIFLDIDGVLNDNKGNDFIFESVNLFREIVDKNNAKVVVISSNQGNGTKVKRKMLTNQLEEVGIDVFDYIDPNFVGKINGIGVPSRLIGIIDYLKKYRDCSYVVLDDEYSSDYDLLEINHYKTDMWTGLKREDLKYIDFKLVDFETFDKVDYKYRELGEYEKVSNDLINVIKQLKKKR